MSDEPGFVSILFADPMDRDWVDGCAMPEFFPDLALDQVVESVLRGREAYNLAPFFYTPLRSTDTVAYRHEVMRDLGQPAVLAAITAFADRMRAVRGRFTEMERVHHPIQERLLFLDAARAYVDGVGRLQERLSELPIRSRGLLGFRTYLRAHTRDRQFKDVADTARNVQKQLGGVRYTMEIRGDRIR